MEKLVKVDDAEARREGVLNKVERDARWARAQKALAELTTHGTTPPPQVVEPTLGGGGKLLRTMRIEGFTPTHTKTTRQFYICRAGRVFFE